MEVEQPEEPEVQDTKDQEVQEPKTDEVEQENSEWIPTKIGHDLYVACMQEASLRALTLGTFRNHVTDGRIVSQGVAAGLEVSRSAVEAYCRLVTRPLEDRIGSVLDPIVEDNKDHHIIVFFLPNEETNFDGGYFLSDEESELLKSVSELFTKISENYEGDFSDVKFTLGDTVFTVVSGDNSIVLSTLPNKVSQNINGDINVEHVSYLLDDLTSKGLVSCEVDEEGPKYSSILKDS